MSFRGNRGGRGMGNGRFQGGGRDMDGGRGGGNRNANRGDPGNRGVSNHTSDAAMAGARIFVGNLPTADSRLSKELLEDTFGSYGRILGISILKGFGFIQYAEEISAENAIRDGQNIEILDHRMDVKPARVGAKDGAGNNSMASPEASLAGANNFRDRSPLRRRDSFDLPGPMRGGGPLGRESDLAGRPGDMMMGSRAGLHSAMDRGGNVRDYDGRPAERDWMANRGEFHRDMDPYSGDPYMDRERPRDSFAPPVADHHRGGFGAPAAPLGSLKMANEVEIVVTSKTGPMRQYAERIEGRVRSKGLIVDVLHPHEDIPLRQILGDLSSRGTLYGIVLTPQNLEHGSLTLNILFGQPEEHRNMPVDDAFDLLSSSFRAYQQLRGRDQASSAGRADGLEPRIGAHGPGRLVTDPHPPTMQALLNALQENRPLSIMEYDRLIGYLGERRNRQAAEETALRGSGGNNQLSSSYQSSVAGSGNQDPQELQQRILSILSSSAAGGGVGGGPAPVPVPAPWSGNNNSAGVEVSSTGPQQDHQQSGSSNNVQKAIDNLIQTDPNLLKHYSQQQPGMNRQQQQPQDIHRLSMMQQQSGYPSYPMGKRF